MGATFDDQDMPLATFGAIEQKLDVRRESQRLDLAGQIITRVWRTIHSTNF